MLYQFKNSGCESEDLELHANKLKAYVEEELLPH